MDDQSYQFMHWISLNQKNSTTRRPQGELEIDVANGWEVTQVPAMEGRWL